jgi:hypothetical protein
MGGGRRIGNVAVFADSEEFPGRFHFVPVVEKDCRNGEPKFTPAEYILVVIKFIDGAHFNIGLTFQRTYNAMPGITFKSHVHMFEALVRIVFVNSTQSV